MVKLCFSSIHHIYIIFILNSLFYSKRENVNMTFLTPHLKYNIHFIAFITNTNEITGYQLTQAHHISEVSANVQSVFYFFIESTSKLFSSNENFQ